MAKEARLTEFSDTTEGKMSTWSEVQEVTQSRFFVVASLQLVGRVQWIGMALRTRKKGAERLDRGHKSETELAKTSRKIKRPPASVQTKKRNGEGFPGSKSAVVTVHIRGQDTISRTAWGKRMGGVGFCLASA
jgi:hypothetical protein